jgi:hypothetical protein
MAVSAAAARPQDVDRDVGACRRSGGVDPTAGAEACRQVGELARPVSRVADEFGVCWWTVMNAVIEHGTPLVDDPHRIGRVRQLGINETSFLAANRTHATIYATGLVDLEGHVVIDRVEGNSAADLRRWTGGADPRWLAGIKVVATDLTESFGAGLSPGPGPYSPGRRPVPRRKACAGVIVSTLPHNLSKRLRLDAPAAIRATPACR